MNTSIPQSLTKRVVRVDQSPMNAQRWCLELECGHECWVTAKAKPKRQTAPCGVCK